MANGDKANGKAKSKVERSDWTVKDNVGTRTVKTTQRNGAPLSYTEYKLEGVSDPAQAMTLLKLKQAKAVKALVIGANRLSRKAAANTGNLVAALAEHKGISLDEARKLIG